MVTTSINTQFHVAKELVDYTLGFEISVDFYYNPSTLSMSNYNAFCGRGNNSAFPSGMFLPGAFVNVSFFGKWKDGALSQISKTGLTADWYRYKMIVTATTVQIKLLNLRTGIEISGNVAAVGTSTISEDKNFTFLCYGIDGVTGAYGSVGVNYSNIKITRGSTCILNVPLAEGAGDKVTDICNSSQYQLSFFTSSSGWAKLSDYCHHNFRYGFTLYTKSASPNLYIPNTVSQTETTVTPPSGYSRIANYKECRLTFNQCESKFKLDNTTVSSVLRCSAAGAGVIVGDYVYNSSNSRWVNTTTGAYIAFQGGTEWYWWNSSGTKMYYYGYAAGTPANVTSWYPSGGTYPNPSQLQNILVTSDLYDADVDHFLFTVGTGVAKELTIQDIYSDIVDSTLDRGHLYINSDSNKNMMLYKTDKGVDTPEDLKIWKYVK